MGERADGLSGKEQSDRGLSKGVRVWGKGVGLGRARARSGHLSAPESAAQQEALEVLEDGESLVFGGDGRRVQHGFVNCLHALRIL